MAHAVNELFTEGHRIDAIVPASRTSAEVTTGWKSMRDFHKAFVLLLGGALAANATVDVKIWQAKDDAGGSAKLVTGKSITPLDSGDDNALCGIELDTSELDVTGEFDWINVQILVGGAAACLLAAALIRYQPRFKAVDYTNFTEIVN